MHTVRRAMTVLGVAVLTMTAPVVLGASAAGAARHRVVVDGYTCTIVSARPHAVVHGRPNAVVCGLGKGDRLFAGGGAEVLIAGRGNDVLVASHAPTSRDVLIGGAGNDRLIGGAGTDTLIGGSGTNTLRAGSGTSSLYAGRHTNHLFGGSGHTTLTGGPGRDVLIAGRGPTTLFGGSGSQLLIGGAGRDTFLGGTSGTSIRAGSGSHDLISASSTRTSIDCGRTSSTVIMTMHGDTVASDCKANGDHTADYQGYQGVVTAVSGTQVTLAFSEENDAAQAWLAANGDPTTVTFDLTGATVQSDTGSISPAVNDCAAVAATTPSSGLVLPAVYVELHTCEGSDLGLQRYRGVITAVSGSEVTLAWSDANDTAQAWLAANGSPSTVTFDVSSATIESETGSQTPSVNDCARIAAETPATGVLLTAVRVSLHHCDGEHSGLLEFRGTVSATATSQMTVSYVDVNDAAQAWLNANGNPTTVTFDLTNATIESDTGSSTPTTGDCVDVSSTAPSSGMILSAVTVELHACPPSEDHTQLYRGSVSAVAGSQVTVTWSDVNDAAQAWLDANGDPASVTFDISGATIESTTGSTSPAVGDCVGVEATAPSSGTVLPALAVVLHACHSDGHALRFGGVVASVTGSTLSLTTSFANDAAQAWLDANGDPNPATFDISSAAIDSHTGAPTPTAGDCAIVDVATAPSSGTTLTAASVELFTCSSGDD